MKISAVLLLVLSLVAVAKAEPWPARYYEAKEALVREAKNGFGGGRVQELTVAGRNVIVGCHYGSGTGAVAGIYVETKGVKPAWTLLAYYARVPLESIEAVIEGNEVVLRNARTKAKLMGVVVEAEKT